MKRIRLYQNTVFKVGDKISLEKNNEHRLLKVLRFPVGNTITLFNGDGFDYQAIVISTKKTYIVEVLSQQKNESESSLDLTLAQGIAKGEKMDFLIQKAVELGVSRIIPIQTEHCVVRLKADKVAKRINHWQKIANHACGQSGRSVIVDISLPQTLTELLNKSNHNGFVFHHRATENLQTMEKPSKVTILIGPEGGLSDAEIRQAIEAGFQSLLLAKRILRTETASLVAIANMQLLWGS
jgi:16S rRNA (uracil1498-N3)-methyltransferase